METETFSPTAKDIYRQALLYVNQKELEARKTGKITIAELFELSSLIVDSIGKSEQLNSYAIYYFDTRDITRSHVINTSIFSTVLAQGIGIKGDELVRVCASALLHDIGIARLDPAIFQKLVSQLEPTEINTVKKHSVIGYQIIIESDNKLSGIAETVYQHHEKGDGSGYPRKLIENEMESTAKILSLVDTYEALIHPRTHRDALVPPMGIQELVRMEGKSFSRSLVKALVDTISLYPAGCYVKLNSGEVAKITQTNKHLPNRPKVKLLFDAKGQTIKPQIIDLAEHNLLYIRKCIPPPGMKPIS